MRLSLRGKFLIPIIILVILGMGSWLLVIYTFFAGS